MKPSLDNLNDDWANWKANDARIEEENRKRWLAERHTSDVATAAGFEPGSAEWRAEVKCALSEPRHEQSNLKGKIMKPRTPPERAIIFAGVLGGLTLEQINDLLKPLAPVAEPVPESSYRMMRKNYFGKMVEGIGSEASDAMNEFGEMIFHPKPISSREDAPE